MNPNQHRCLRLSQLFVLALLVLLNVMTAARGQTADAFNPGANDLVFALVPQPDGQVLVGGQFTNLCGQGREKMGRLNADGTLDTVFEPGVGGSGFPVVSAFAVQPDKRILAGGFFSTMAGQPRGSIGRINLNGTLDDSFTTGAYGKACVVGPAVYAMVVQADAKTLVGGCFTNLGGQARNCIGRLDTDGALDTAFAPNADNTVRALAVQPDGKILVGGYFGTMGGQARARIARLDTDGTLDPTFDPGAGGGSDPKVLCLAVQPDGKIIVGGSFNQLAGQSCTNLGRLNQDGTLDSSFNLMANSAVGALALQADGRILVGGVFTTLGGQPCAYLGRVNANGTLDTGFNASASSGVLALALQSDGKLLAGGNFTSLGGQARTRIGRLNNTEPATQNMEFDGWTITWLRGGTSPEVWRVIFEVSTNSSDWTRLGEGGRVAGGWQLTGVSVPGTCTIRGRGFVVGADYYGTSSWFVESTLGVSTQAPPVIVSQPQDQTAVVGGDASFTVQAGGTAPLSYQWQFNGTDLPDATDTMLSLTGIQRDRAGEYQVVVANDRGFATSQVARLSVIVPNVVAWGYNGEGEANVPAELTNVVAISSGWVHTLALREDGTVVAWGSDYYGQLDVPAGLSNVVAVAASDAASLVLKSDGTLVAWGQYNDGATNVPMTVPPGLSNVVEIAAGFHHFLALQADHTITVWGNSWYDRTVVPAGVENTVAIAAGGWYSMALQADGRVVAWGYNGNGETNVPLDLTNAVAISGGGWHDLALRSDRTVTAWGYNNSGQASVPPGLTGVADVAAGRYHSSAVLADGTATSWGDNYYYQTNVPAGLSNVVAMAGRGNFSVALVGRGRPFLTQPLLSRTALAGETVYFHASATGEWPLSYQWQFNGTDLPDATNAWLSLEKIQLTAAGEYRVVVANNSGAVTSSVARLDVPNVRVWGYNGEGQAVIPAQLMNACAIAAGYAHTLALRSDGTVVAWGYNGFGQTSVPVGLTNVVAVAAGYAYSVALKSDGTVAAWGQYYNGTGWIPMTVPAGLSNVVAIAAGYHHCLALHADQTITAWGFNDSSQADVPAGMSSVVSIASSGWFSMALQSNGRVMVWGSNAYGQTNVPPELTNVVAIAGGGFHCMAIRDDSTVAAWGDDNFGEATVPAGLIGVAGVAGGWIHSLAMGSDGTVAAWGGDFDGQTNVPAGLSQVVAVAGGGGFSAALVGQGRPFLTQPLLSRTALAGETVYFHASATGEWPLSYQWQFNGTDVPDATNAWLGLTGIQPSQAGGYSLVVSNSYGSVTSQVAALTVFVPPFIVTQPLSRALPAGGACTFTVGAEGDAPLSYQWRLNDIELAGATDASLSLPNAQLANMGSYTVVVSNNYGAITSTVAMLMIEDFSGLDATNLVWTSYGPMPWFIQTNVTYDGISAAQSGPITDSQQSVLETSVMGPATLSFWWKSSCEYYSDGGQFFMDEVYQASIYGDTDWQQLAYYLPAGPHTLRWVYAKNESGSGGQDAVWLDQLSLVPGGTAPFISYQPASRAVAPGQNFSVSVTPGGTEPFSYQWRLNGTDIPGATVDYYSIGRAQAVDYGTYSVVVSNDYGFAVSSNAIIEMGQIATYPSGTSVPLGLTNVVAVAASGYSTVSGYFNLALRANQTVAAWGTAVPVVNVPAGLTNVTAIAAGAYHAMALRGNGSVYAWGPNTAQVFVPIAAQENVIGIAASTFASLALKNNGSVIAWGFNTLVTNIPPDLSNVVALAAGVNHGMALRANGTVQAWGNNSYSQTNVPVGLNDAVAITAGDNYCVALRANGKLIMWGQGSPAISNFVSAVSNAVAVSSRGGPIYYLRADGTASWHMPGPSGPWYGLSNLVTLSAGNPQSLALVGSGPPFLTTPMVDRTLRSGETAYFYAQATGEWPLSYQWRHSGTNLPGATKPWLALTNLQFADSGTYSVAVSNRVGLLTNAPAAALTVLSPPAVVAQPQNQKAVAGTTVSFAVGLQGTPTFFYQWLRDGTDLPGATTATLTLANVQPADAGTYSVVITNAFGAVASAPAVLSVIQPPVIEVPPTSQSITQGGTATFSVQASGTAPLRYRWQFRSSSITGATNMSLTLTNVQPASAGAYSVVITNDAGAITSAPVTLTVLGPPTIIARPLSQTVLGGAAAQFTVVASGSPPLSYQWRFNGADISGGTSAVLTLPGVQPSTEGAYSVVVANPAGAVTSAPPASLTVVMFAATQSSLPAYQSPGNFIVSCQIVHALNRPLYFLLWQPGLPAGWTLQSATGDGNPVVDGNGVVLSGASLPNPIRFTYTAGVAANLREPAEVYGGLVYFMSGMTNTAYVSASPNPLLLNYGALLFLQEEGVQGALTLLGDSDSAYALQTSTNLVDWVDVGNLLPVGGIAKTNRPADKGAEFYRARKLSP